MSIGHSVERSGLEMEISGIHGTNKDTETRRGHGIICRKRKREEERLICRKTRELRGYQQAAGILRKEPEKDPGILPSLADGRGGLSTNNAPTAGECSRRTHRVPAFCGNAHKGKRDTSLALTELTRELQELQNTTCNGLQFCLSYLFPFFFFMNKHFSLVISLPTLVFVYRVKAVRSQGFKPCVDSRPAETIILARPGQTRCPVSPSSAAGLPPRLLWYLAWASQSFKK